MTLQLIPTADAPHFVQRTTLDGTPYLFTFRLNERENTYRFDIATADGTPIIEGVKVVCSRPLLERVQWNLGAPQHLLLALANGSDDSPPGLGELGEGKRVTLYYMTAEDLEALL